MGDDQDGYSGDPSVSSTEHVRIPETGRRIEGSEDGLDVPDVPIVPCIEGDGIGGDIGPVMRDVVDRAVAIAYGGDRSIRWMRTYAGESADRRYGTVLPEETVELLREYRVGIKGPLTTPVGAGYRSLNVALRRKLDLYVCFRPVYYLDGLPSPVTDPEAVDLVVFRENTEDVYSGVEWAPDSEGSRAVRRFLEVQMGVDQLPAQPVGLGVKPISEFATKRLVRRAIDFALDQGRDTVTLVHKGNIMKFTEGAFRDWGYEVANEEYGDRVITENTLWEERDGERPPNAVVVNDRLADNMLQQLLTRTSRYDVLVLPNLNGDYVSDAAGGMIGGLGICPGANLGDGRALFEPTHGSAPKYAGQDKVNPTAILLSAREMLRYMGWSEAARRIVAGLERTIGQKRVTYDLARQMEGATKLACSEFGEAVMDNMRKTASAPS